MLLYAGIADDATFNLKNLVVLVEGWISTLHFWDSNHAVSAGSAQYLSGSPVYLRVCKFRQKIDQLENQKISFCLIYVYKSNQYISYLVILQCVNWAIVSDQW